MKKLFTLIGFLAISLVALSQDEVTLVVSGQGTTKDEATTKALRSAIEQAFGVFVSANTEILDDELVKDEIATVSSGNIQKYEELGALTLPNGMNEVTLQATVSVKKLTSYARSHGSSAEFAGATFVANQKMIRLNQQNSAKAIENLYRQIKEMGKDLYDCELKIGDPNPDGTVWVTLSYYANDNARTLGNLFLNTIKSVAIPGNMVRDVSDAVPYTLTYFADDVTIKDYSIQHGKLEGRREGVIYLYNALPEILDEEMLNQKMKKVYDSIERFVRQHQSEWGKAWGQYPKRILRCIAPLQEDHGDLTACSFRFLNLIKLNNTIGVGNFYEIFDNLGNKYCLKYIGGSNHLYERGAREVINRCEINGMRTMTVHEGDCSYDEILNIIDSAGLMSMLLPTDTDGYLSLQKEYFSAMSLCPYVYINNSMDLESRTFPEITSVS